MRRTYIVHVESSGPEETVERELVRALRDRFARTETWSARQRVDETWQENDLIEDA